MIQVENTIAENVDSVFLFIAGISALLLLGITATMLYFVFRYSRKRHPKAQQVKSNTWLEVTWTVLPTILVLVMFYYGYEGFALMRDVPANAMEVQVTARMWDWTFEYDNGIKAKQLYVPVNRPIKLSLKSVDVVHSFYLPSFRVKEDVVPGKENYLWFKPQTTGPADIFCAEYCGQRHAYMMSQVIVMGEDEFQRWYESGGAERTLPSEAVSLGLLSKHACTACHGLDDDIGGAPPFRGIFGRKTTVLVDGEERQIVVDEEYLRRAITEPGAELVKGYDDDMDPPEDLTPEELEQIIDYLKGLK